MNPSSELILTVSDFVAVFNQTLEYAYPSVTVQGELANLRVSKGKWVYFDLKDEYASVKFFGTVYQLPGPLEDGLLLQVSGQPRLHPLYGFSINVQSIRPVGEGSIKRAAALLEAKLQKEGLFDESRKRPLPYPPKRIGLITSRESAAYHDFVKILNQRWSGLEILLFDVQVQGESSPAQLIAALEYFNTNENPVEVVVLTRGGGSPEDLAAFSTEQVTRAVAGSRIPTLVAVGHEVDVSLAELAADLRASTPSNAAELLTPDKRQEIIMLEKFPQVFNVPVLMVIGRDWEKLQKSVEQLNKEIKATVSSRLDMLRAKRQVLDAYNPNAVLDRGYAIIRKDGKLVRSVKRVRINDQLDLTVSDGTINAKVHASGRK